MDIVYSLEKPTHSMETSSLSLQGQSVHTEVTCLERCLFDLISSHTSFFFYLRFLVGIFPKMMVIPVPVPIYVPVPMAMYSQLTPQAVALPLPVRLPSPPDTFKEAETS